MIENVKETLKKVTKIYHDNLFLKRSIRAHTGNPIYDHDL